METLYQITIDGKLDEPAWANAKEYTDFRKRVSQGGELVENQTIMKVLQDKDAVYFGFKCMESDIPQVIETHPDRDIWGTDRIELFISPSGGTYDFYQFVTTFGGRQISIYYAEGGQITPDPFAPEWESKVYVGDGFWSVEMKIPLIALYMNNNASMSGTWLLNPIRGRTVRNGRCVESSCCNLHTKFWEFDKFLVVDGFYQRPAEDDLRIVSALVDITDKTENGYCGTMEVKVEVPVDETFTFTSNYGETAKVTLTKGANVFTVPCSFPKLGRDRISLALTRENDGKCFMRYYPVTVQYEPIKLHFTRPEYRCNFYPGQDYSKIVGTAISSKPVTLKLEGPGIETREITPNADGSFCFETPGFEVGEAWLTATAGDEVKKQKIRRLAPTGHMMAWISGGNLVVDGKPTQARTVFSPGFRCGKVFFDHYLKSDYHETRHVRKVGGFMAPRPALTRVLKLPKAEVFQDGMPCEELLRYYDKMIEDLKNEDFVYYYLSDEPECAGVSPIYLKNAYDYIADKDPYHVINIVSRSAKNYVECADWFETHPYINPQNLPDGRRIYNRPMKSLGNFVDDIAALNRPDKCIGIVPQIYSYEGKSIYSDYPTLDEFVCSTWAGMIHGGKTINPYATGDMRDRPHLEESVRYLYSGFEALEDFILFGKRKQLLRTDKAECVIYENGSEKMFVLVNFEQEAQTVTVDGLTGTWHHFRNEGKLSGNTFTLKPLEVIIGTSEKKDTGLPTYAETVALCEKLEAQRVAGCSKLVALRNDIKLTGEGVLKHRLFDGVRDNWAMPIGRMGGFLEVDLSKVNVSFDKIVVSGYNLKEHMTLQVKYEEDFVTPELVEVQEENLSTTYLFRKTVCPKELRLDFFGGEPMELYELEAF